MPNSSWKPAWKKLGTSRRSKAGNLAPKKSQTKPPSPKSKPKIEIPLKMPAVVEWNDDGTAEENKRGRTKQ